MRFETVAASDPLMKAGRSRTRQRIANGVIRPAASNTSAPPRRRSLRQAIVEDVAAAGWRWYRPVDALTVPDGVRNAGTRALLDAAAVLNLPPLDVVWFGPANGPDDAGATAGRSGLRGRYVPGGNVVWLGAHLGVAEARWVAFHEAYHVAQHLRGEDATTDDAERAANAFASRKVGR